MWSRRSSAFPRAELLGKSDEQPFRPADVTQPIDVFVLDDLSDELRALAESLERVVEVFDGEHDAEVTERVHRRCAVIRDDGRPDEAGELEPAVAVRRPHHRDLDVLIAQARDASCPFAFDRRPTLELEA